ADKKKQKACEAFVNFMSRPDIVVRNMYYIGYTSVIAGGDDTRIFEYADWCYGAEEDEESELVDYSLDYFFSDNPDGKDYVITADIEQTKRQLFGQYPTEDVLNRASIMEYCGKDTMKDLNQMWINVRCYNPFR
nr:spermidine/putrescine ABC transporter substrate-binding protein [Lachnospiraceae bacterium]